MSTADILNESEKRNKANKRKDVSNRSIILCSVHGGMLPPIGTQYKKEQDRDHYERRGRLGRQTLPIS
jgi:hypothetical protein